MTYILKEPCKYHVQATDVRTWRGARSFRQRVAWLLISVARHLIGGHVLHIEVETQPELTDAEVAACLKAGLDETSKLIAMTVRAHATENLFRRTHAWMFEDEGHPGKLKQGSTKS